MIQFTKDIDQSKLRMAYNNDVIRFYSSSTAAPLSCDVNIGPDVAVTLYPNPTGQFFFNFMPYVSAIINTRNFEDTVLTDITVANPESFVYNVANGTTYSRAIILSITLDNDTTDAHTYNLTWLAGVQQLGSYRRFEVTDWLLLSPPQQGMDNSYYLKYWQGYPFDFGFYTAVSSMTLTNQTNLLTQTFTVGGYGDRLFFSDGRTDETLEDVIPLSEGFNRLLMKEDTIKPSEGKMITLEKVPYKCGVYLKWFNERGGYNYWLFENTYSIDRSTKQLGELDRDNNNLEDTFARTIQIGKESQDTIKIVAELLTEDERDIVQGILDSPKVYLFTGQPYARNDYHNWIEVSLKTSSARIKNPRQPLTNFTFDIELPVRYGQSI